MSLAQKIADVFSENGWVWKYKDGDKVPPVEDVKMVLDRLRDDLVDYEGEGEQPQIEMGRLIMKKREGHYDVFVWLGEHDENL